MTLSHKNTIYILRISICFYQITCKHEMTLDGHSNKWKDDCLSEQKQGNDNFRF